MPLHDILPPIEINNSLLFYVVGVLLLLLILFFIYLYKIQKKPLSPFQILELSDYTDAKKTALQFSYYGKKIFEDEATKSKFLALNEKLKAYKYSKHTTTIPQELKESMRELLEQARAEHG